MQSLCRREASRALFIPGEIQRHMLPVVIKMIRRSRLSQPDLGSIKMSDDLPSTPASDVRRPLPNNHVGESSEDHRIRFRAARPVFRGFRASRQGTISRRSGVAWRWKAMSRLAVCVFASTSAADFVVCVESASGLSNWPTAHWAAEFYVDSREVET